MNTQYNFLTGLQKQSISKVGSFLESATKMWNLTPECIHGQTLQWETEAIEVAGVLDLLALQLWNFWVAQLT